MTSIAYLEHVAAGGPDAPSTPAVGCPVCATSGSGLDAEDQSPRNFDIGVGEHTNFGGDIIVA